MGKGAETDLRAAYNFWVMWLNQRDVTTIYQKSWFLSKATQNKLYFVYLDVDLGEALKVAQKRYIGCEALLGNIQNTLYLVHWSQCRP